MEEFATPISLGAAIKARRQQFGWSQEELAQRVAARGDATFRQSDVSRLELGKVALPHHNRLAHIAAVLGLPVGELLARSGWSGANVAFMPPPFRAPDAAQDSAPADASNAAPARRLLAGPTLRDGRQRAEELIAQAQAAWERSQEILQQCEMTRAQAARVIGTAQQHGGAAASDQD